MRAVSRDMFAHWRFERSLRALARSEHAILRDYAAANWPQRDQSVAESTFLALDFELDGLRSDAHILQAGWVPFEGPGIAMTNAMSLDVRSDADLDAQAVTIHGIGEQRAAKGEPLKAMLEQLIPALSGRILVAHAAGIECGALQRATKAAFGAELPIRSICTLALEKHLHPNLVGGEAYRLGPARHRYGLPDYSAHDALTDAIAAAELFQAQLTRMGDDVLLSQLER